MIKRKEKIVKRESEFGEYRPVRRHSYKLPPCGFCYSAAELQCFTGDGLNVTYLVACTLSEDKSPTGDDCPLFMPPESFHKASPGAAVKYWTAWADLSYLRREHERQASIRNGPLIVQHPETLVSHRFTARADRPAICLCGHPEGDTIHRLSPGTKVSRKVSPVKRGRSG